MENPNMTRVRGLLDTQFDECNTLASALRAKAISLIGEGTQISEQFIVSEHGDPSNIVLSPIQIVPQRDTYTRLKIGEGDIQTVAFALMRDINSVTEQESPKLLAIFEHDVALPIASFDKRPGACSHVQIGSQMRDDTIVTTNKDQRQAELQAVKALLEAQHLTDEQRASLVSVIEEEIRSSRAVFDKARIASFSRFMFGVLHKSNMNEQRDMLFLGESIGQSTRRVMQLESVDGMKEEASRFWQLPEVCIAQDVRETKFIERFSATKRRVARQMGGISILAVTRSRVATEIFGVSGEGAIRGFEDSSLWQQIEAARGYFSNIPELKSELISAEKSQKTRQQVDAKTAIYAQRKYFIKSFGTDKVMNRLLGAQRTYADEIVAYAMHRIADGQHEVLATVRPGTEFSTDHDSTSVSLKFTERAFNAIGVVCHVKPTSTDMAPVEAYNETIFLDKPNEDPKSLVNYSEITRLLGFIKQAK